MFLVSFRPQLLILLKPNDQLEPKHRKMLTFANQLKAGKGLTLVGSILEGDYREMYANAQAAHQVCTMKGNSVYYMLILK